MAASTPGLVGPGDLGVGQPAGRRPDARERRAEVVRDRVDEGGLEARRSGARPRGPMRGLAELVAPQRDSAIWSAARASTRVSTRVGSPRARSRSPTSVPSTPPSTSIRARYCGIVGRRGAGRRPPSSVGPDPVRRLVAGRPDEVRRDARRAAAASPSPVSASDRSAPVGPATIQTRSRPAALAHPRGDLGRGLRGRRCGRQRSTEGEQRVRLGRPPRGFVGAGALRRHEPTRRRGPRTGTGRDPAPRAGRRSTSENRGFGEQEVVGEERGDGRGDGRDRAGAAHRRRRPRRGRRARRRRCR